MDHRRLPATALIQGVKRIFEDDEILPLGKPLTEEGVFLIDNEEKRFQRQKKER